MDHFVNFEHAHGHFTIKMCKMCISCTLEQKRRHYQKMYTKSVIIIKCAYLGMDIILHIGTEITQLY